MLLNFTQKYNNLTIPLLSFRIGLFSFVCLIWLNGCREDPENIRIITDIPTVITLETINIQNGNAEVKGIIVDNGMLSVTTSGICWSRTTQFPTIETAQSIQLTAGPDGAFSGLISELAGGSTYYVRAFAINEKGIAYGNIKDFDTPPIFSAILSPFPSNLRMINSMAYFSMNGHFYILGGDLGASLTDELWRYSVADDLWVQLNNFIDGPMRCQSAVSYGSGAFVFGGYNFNEDVRPDIYYYDTNANIWTSYEGPDSSPVYWTIGFTSGNSVYYVGGMSRDKVRDDVWCFHVPTTTWQKKTAFPVQQYGGVACVIDNIAYVGLGSDSLGVCNGELWSTADSALTWQLKTSFSAFGKVLGGVVCNKRLYVIDESNHITEYNPETNSWKKKSPMPLRLPTQGIYSFMNKIYIDFSPFFISVYDPLWDIMGQI